MSIYTNRNYHYSQNKINQNNLNNLNTKIVYPQQPQPNQQMNHYFPKNNSFLLNRNQQQNPNNIRQISPTKRDLNILYAPTNSKYLANANFPRAISPLEKANFFGHNAEETLFKRTLRKPEISTAIQSSSYGIINNIPSSAGLHQSRYNSGNNKNRFTNQRKDHVGSLLNYNEKNSTDIKNFKFPPPQYDSQIKTECKVGEDIRVRNKTNLAGAALGIITDSNQKGNIYSERNVNKNIPLKNEIKSNLNNSDYAPEKISIECPEYYEKNAIAVKEYAYKENQNETYRNYMEDKGRAVDCLKNNKNNALFCLFDGHGGAEVSKFLQENMHNEFRNIIPNDNLESSIITLFESVDEKIKNSNFSQVGSTGCVVFITRENGRRFLYCANIGDTRCILTNDKEVQRLSYDDRASDKNEYERIINAGGVVFAGRVYGQLMLSRAFGDWEFKSYGVINVPHILRIEISDKDQYVIMGSDGIWDVFSDEDVYKLSKEYTSADELCKKIINDALDKGTMDNISCFVIKLN
ncbi:MAG: protein phosphatase 2C domain-containing protein [archaeon]|nr:protein phosphatase 2C domain-containing protein [archaeon]